MSFEKSYDEPIHLSGNIQVKKIIDYLYNNATVYLDRKKVC